MVKPIPLHHVNGGEKWVPKCANCGAELPDEQERAAAHSISGTKFFCKLDKGDDPQYSCYSIWKRGHQ